MSILFYLPSSFILRYPANMNKTIVARVVLMQAEHADLVREAGRESLSAFLRRKLGLQPLRRGGSQPGSGRPKKNKMP